MTVRWRRSDDGDNGDGGVRTRVSRQKQDSKEKEKRRPLNRFLRPIRPVLIRHENATVHFPTQLTKLKWRAAHFYTTVQFNGQISDLSSSTKAELTYRYKKNSSTMKQRRVASQGTQELGSYRKNSEISQTTRTSAEKGMTTQKTRFFPLQMASKNTRLHILQDPTNS